MTLFNFNIGTDTIKHDLTKTNNLPTIIKDQILKIICWNVNGIRATQSKGYFDNFLNKGIADLIIIN